MSMDIYESEQRSVNMGGGVKQGEVTRRKKQPPGGSSTGQRMAVVLTAGSQGTASCSGCQNLKMIKALT